jgi:translation initiation factor 1
MSKKKIQLQGGLVYSTDPNFKLTEDDGGKQETLIPSQQKLSIRLETKHRAGKAVTLVEGFIGSTTDMEELGKKLKSFCGTGGSIKDGKIIVQGDNRDKLLLWLQKNGYKLVRKI